MRYVYGVTAAILLGGAATTLTLNPVGAQTAQNAPAAMAAVPRPGAPPSFADLVDRLQPAVVNISTDQTIQMRAPQLPPGFEEFFRRFGAPIPEGGESVTRRGGSLGSGFIISPDGYVVTNNHVVAPAREDAVVEQVRVTLVDGTAYDATVVGRDELADIAVLKINSDRPLPFVRFGDSSQVRVGDWVLAIGNPFSLGGTVTAGIVSAVHRNINSGLYDRYIQTDASINSGNSGGPMFDLQGNVIGVNTALISPTGGNVGIGFAIPAEQIRPVVEALRRGERVRRGYIGVGLQPLSDSLSDSLAAALGLERNRGELIPLVTPDSPADRAGIRQGDVVISVAGQPVTRDQTLAYLISRQPIGATVPLEIVRQGRRITANVTIAERPSEDELSRLNNAAPEQSSVPEPPKEETQSAGQRSTEGSLGLAVTALTPEIARGLQLPDTSLRGVVIARVTNPNSDAAQKGLQRGDVILSINQVPTPTPEAAAAALEAARRAGRDTVLLLVRRGDNQPAFIGVDLAER